MVKKRGNLSVNDNILGKPFRLPKTVLGLPTQKKKDSRRSFSPTQKKQILAQQNNKCARCHEKLDPRAIHYHHKKPWTSGGRTIVGNGKALCPKCHEITTHETRLDTIDKGRKPRNSNPLF